MTKPDFGADDAWLLAMPFVGPGLFVAKQLSDSTQVTSTEQSKDMEAINAFMMNAYAKTNRAAELQNQWVTFWNNLNWYGKSVSNSDYDEARNRRNAFVVANEESPEGQELVRQQIAAGVSAEEMRGETKRSNQSGFFDAPTSDEDRPFFPPWTLKAVGATILAGIGIGIAAAINRFLR